MGWAISALAFLLYLVTLSHHYSADSVLFALRIEGDQLGQIVDPTHLLVEPLGHFWVQLWVKLGWDGGPLRPLQVINALAGAISVGLLYRTARGMTASRKVAGLASAGFAISGGLWLLSTEAESATIGLVPSLLVLWLLLTPPESVAGWRGYEALLGVAVSLAILTYLSGVILVPTVVAGLLLRESDSRRRRSRGLALFLAVVAIICLLAAGAVLSYRSWPDWRQTIWQDGGQAYAALSWFDAPHGIYAFLRSLGLFPGLAFNESARALLNGVGGTLRITFFGYYGLLSLVALAPCYLAIRRRARIRSRWRKEMIVLVVWTAGYAAFAIYWVPGDITFWLPLLAVWWLLVALVVAAWEVGQVSDQRLADWPWLRRPARLLAAFIALLAITNALISILPRRNLATNGPYQLAMDIGGRTTEADLIVTDPDDIETLYLVYFGRRTVLPAAGASADVDGLRRRYADLLRATRAAGGRTFLLQDQQLSLLGP